ncbi:MAG: hypothetical protein LBR32_01295 [Propionibacteriaceae bacterium]|jgi:hypothetical protein|nr:hypothetical protein [Propionibacteriaceae bacterium]
MRVKAVAVLRAVVAWLVALGVLAVLVLAFSQPSANMTVGLVAVCLLCGFVSGWVRKGGMTVFGLLYWVGAAMIAGVGWAFPGLADFMDAPFRLYFIPLAVFTGSSVDEAVLRADVVFAAAVIAATVAVHFVARLALGRRFGALEQEAA